MTERQHAIIRASLSAASSVVQAAIDQAVLLQDDDASETERAEDRRQVRSLVEHRDALSRAAAWWPQSAGEDANAQGGVDATR